MAHSNGTHNVKADVLSSLEILHDHPGSIEPVRPSSDYALDGSVDIKGNPITSKSCTGGWKASAFIIGVELSERIAYYGIQSNLLMYLTTILHEDLATAIKNVTDWVGVTLVVPIAGGFFADAYWGRYWTIAVVSIIYVIGLIFLTLSVSIASLRPPPCSPTQLSTCRKASSSQLGFFFFSLYLVSLGTGGIKPCLEAFGADQFDDEDPVERKEKTSFFNWWYFGLCTGGLFAVTVLVYIQDNVSWGLGFGIPAVAMAISCGIFFAGTLRYRHQLPGGSPLTRIAQVFVAALRNWNAKVPDDENQLHEILYDESMPAARRQLLHTRELVFLDRAAVDRTSSVLGHVNPRSRWKLCTVTQVEETKQILKVVPIWLSTFAYGVVFAQSATLFTKQVSTMNRYMGPRFQVPPASMQALTTVVVLLSVPVYDRLFVPVARSITGNERGITMLQRIGTGLFLSILSMVVAALTELRRLRAAREHGLLDNPKETIPITAFWLLPQYAVLGIADVFTLVGQQEFFYDQVPDSMRSLGLALYLSAVGVGSFIGSLLVTIVNNRSSRGGRRPWIVDNLNRSQIYNYYWLLAVLSAINLIAFVLVAKLYRYKKVKSRVLPDQSPFQYRNSRTSVRGLSQKDSLQRYHHRLSDASQVSSTP